MNQSDVNLTTKRRGIKMKKNLQVWDECIELNVLCPPISNSEYHQHRLVPVVVGHPFPFDKTNFL
jgi:hypothetical protein